MQTIPQLQIIISADLKLEPVKNEDIDEITVLWSDINIRKYLPPPHMPWPWTTQDSIDFVKSSKPVFEKEDCRMAYTIMQNNCFHGIICFTYYPEF